MSATKKSTLLQKYNIPVDHLDFKYLEKCVNSKEVEQIVEILKSGEEGYYPDLTRYAENRLRALNPHSKCLRNEEPIRRQQTMESAEWSEITNMLQVLDRRIITFLLYFMMIVTLSFRSSRVMSKMRPKLFAKHRLMVTISPLGCQRYVSQPHRQMIQKITRRNRRVSSHAIMANGINTMLVRICLNVRMNVTSSLTKFSFFYNRNRSIKNRSTRREKSRTQRNQKEKVSSNRGNRTIGLRWPVTNGERETCRKVFACPKSLRFPIANILMDFKYFFSDKSVRHRICGNECFRSSDFDEAIVEYTKSLNIIIDARSFNNRAMACGYFQIAHSKTQ